MKVYSEWLVILICLCFVYLQRFSLVERVILEGDIYQLTFMILDWILFEICFIFLVCFRCQIIISEVVLFLLLFEKTSYAYKPNLHQ